MKIFRRPKISLASMGRRSGQSGFTLIEVLVSVIVLSIGLVGVAGLQATSLANNQSAIMRSQASALAYDLADRMRSNITSANAGMYDPTAAAAVASCATVAGCTPQELANNDLDQWITSLADNLPLGEGFVCIDSTPNDGSSSTAPACDGVGSQFSVKVWWDDNRDGDIDLADGYSDLSTTSVERLAIIFQL